MERICRKFAHYLCKKEYADIENVEDLRFLLELVITQIITLTSVYAIGLLFMDAYSIAIICTVFVLGRRYIDGYHASTFFMCYILTVATFLFSITMSFYVSYIEVFYITGLLLSMYLVIKYKYYKIIYFNICFLLVILIINTGIIYNINIVNYWIIIVMRVVRGDELYDIDCNRR